MPETPFALSPSLLPRASTARDPPYLSLIPTSVCIRAWEGGTGEPEVDFCDSFRSQKDSLKSLQCEACPALSGWCQCANAPALWSGSSA